MQLSQVMKHLGPSLREKPLEKDPDSGSVRLSDHIKMWTDGLNSNYEVDEADLLAAHRAIDPQAKPNFGNSGDGPQIAQDTKTIIEQWASLKDLATNAAEAADKLWANLIVPLKETYMANTRAAEPSGDKFKALLKKQLPKDFQYTLGV